MSDWRLGLRTHPRYKTFLPASLASETGTMRAHILDVSASGARVHSPSPLAMGARVTLMLPGEHRRAEVAWSRETKAGLRFDVPLSQAMIGELLRSNVS